MISLTQHRDDTILVVGYGKSGQSAAAALSSAGARIAVWDDDADKRGAAGSDSYDVLDVETTNLTIFDEIIWSPGVPHTFPHPHPLAEKAKAAGHRLRCDVDLLAASQPDATYVGITGTNGKSTTTVLTGHILAQAGMTVRVGGNLGTPVLELDPLPADGIYVLELSSYQLELAPTLACDIAVLLNIAADHRDRHGGFDGYVTAKTQLFLQQSRGSTAIVGLDDERSRAVFESLTKTHRTVGVSAEHAAPAHVYVSNRHLVDAFGHDPQDVIDLSELVTLPGQHNWQNAAASYAIARTLGADVDAITEGLRTYPGLAHRQEVVGSVGGVTFVNDSKATNAAAAGKALSCYGYVYWIAGGQPKEDGITELNTLFGRVRQAFLIGDAANAFAETLQDADVEVSFYDSLEDAVSAAGHLAIAEAREDATVLLSPACASFDMFDNFEHRGNVFRTAVHKNWPTTASSTAGGHA